MKININGKIMEPAENTNLHDLIESTKVKADTFIAVLNDVVVRKDLWVETLLKEGDRLDLVSLVGGG